MLQYAYARLKHKSKKLAEIKTIKSPCNLSFKAYKLNEQTMHVLGIGFNSAVFLDSYAMPILILIYMNITVFNVMFNIYKNHAEIKKKNIKAAEEISSYLEEKKNNPKTPCFGVCWLRNFLKLYVTDIAFCNNSSPNKV